MFSLPGPIGRSRKAGGMYGPHSCARGPGTQCLPRWSSGWLLVFWRPHQDQHPQLSSSTCSGCKGASYFISVAGIKYPDKKQPTGKEGLVCLTAQGYKQPITMRKPRQELKLHIHSQEQRDNCTQAACQLSATTPHPTPTPVLKQPRTPLPREW